MPWWSWLVMGLLGGWVLGVTTLSFVLLSDLIRNGIPNPDDPPEGWEHWKREGGLKRLMPTPSDPGV